MTRKLFGLASLALLAAIAGCSSLDRALDLARIEKAVVSVNDAQLTHISFDQAKLQFTLNVDNPNPVPIELAGFDYRLRVNERQMLAGEQREGVKIAAGKTSQFTLPVTLKFADILAAAKDLSEAKALEYTLETDALVDLPIMGVTRIPAQKRGELPIPQLPRILLDGIRIQDLGLTGVNLEIDLNLINPNAFGVAIDGLDYGLNVSGQQWLQGTLGTTVTLAQSGASGITLPLRLSFAEMGRSLMNLLTQQSPLEYELVGNMNMDAGLPGLSDIALPFSEAGSVIPSRDKP